MTAAITFTMNKATTKHKIRFLNTCINKTLFMWTFIQYKYIHSTTGTHHSSLSVYIFKHQLGVSFVLIITVCIYFL